LQENSKNIKSTEKAFRMIKDKVLKGTGIF